MFNFFLFICAFIPFQFALNPTSQIDLAVLRVIIPAYFLILIFCYRKIPDWKKTTSKLIFLFLALATISLIFSHNYAWSLRKLAFLFSLFPAYFIALWLLADGRRARIAIAWLVGGGFLAALLGLSQYFSQFVFGIDPVYLFFAKNIAPFFLGENFSQAVLAYPSWLVSSASRTYMRAIGTFPDPHMFSYYLGLLVPWSIALWKTSVKHKKLFLLFSIVIVFADVFTFTRGGYVAMIAGCLSVFPFLSKKGVLQLAAGVLVFLVLILCVPHNPVGGRFISSFDTKEGSNSVRIGNWKQAFDIIAAHPFGTGIGMYSLSVDPGANYREPIYAHNLYLDLMAELSLAAVLAFIGILFVSAYGFWRKSRSNKFYLAGICSIVIFAIHSLFETPLYSVHVLTLFLIIIALAAYDHDQKTTKN